MFICYLCCMKLIQMKKYVSFLITFCVFFIAEGQVVINEYSAANYDSFQDSINEFSDHFNGNGAENTAKIISEFLQDKK